MAKQRIQPIDLSKENLIKQPTAYTLMPKKATLTQLKVFVVVMYRLQAFFNAALNNKYQHGNIVSSKQLFLDFEPANGEFTIAKETSKLVDKGDVLLDIPLRDLRIESKNYPAAIETLWRVASTPCVITDEETGQQKVTNFMYILKDGNITTETETVEVRDKRTGKIVKKKVEHVRYKRPRISLGIPRAVAGQIFDIDVLGYDQFNLPAALETGSIYTLLLYTLVSGQWHRGNMTFEKDYQELREELGFFDGNGPDEKNADKYPEWSQFDRAVTAVAKRELDDKLKRGEIDLSFSYTPVFVKHLNPDTGRPKKTVTKITFTAIPSDKENAQAKAAANDVWRKLAEMLTTELRLTDAQVNGKRKGIIARVQTIAGEEGATLLTKKVNELLADKAKRTDIESVGKWAWRSIDNWIGGDLTTIFKQREEEAKKRKQQQEVAEKQGRGEVAKSETKEKAAPQQTVERLVGADGQVWYNTVIGLRSQVSETEYRHWVEPAANAVNIRDKVVEVVYYGNAYKGQRARQNEAFLKLLAAVRKALPERIADIHAVNECGGKRYEL